MARLFISKTRFLISKARFGFRRLRLDQVMEDFPVQVMDDSPVSSDGRFRFQAMDDFGFK
jgi:hypothetical protein